MRYVEKDLKDIPPTLIAPKTLEDIEKIAIKDANVQIKDSIYKGVYKDADGKSQSEVRDILNKFYKQKCAYCEQTCKAEIEHYRPKKAVIEDKLHNGYYWLCYTWSNLVPSCRYCNTEGGKGNQFPVINKGKRVTEPSFILGKLDKSKCQAFDSPLLEEEPYLLHPEIDNDPHNFLSFELSEDKNGVTIIGIDEKERGKKTIKICNLNRSDLRLNRLKEVCYHMKQKINIIFTLNANGTIPDDKLGDSLALVYKELEKESKDNTLTHTLLRKFLIFDAKNFEDYFLPYIDSEPVREIALESFRVFKSK